MSNNYHTMTYYVIDYGDLDDIIDEHFPQLQWSDTGGVVANKEWNNDTCHAFDDITEEPEWESDRAGVRDLISGKNVRFLSVRHILLALANREVIPPGNWLIVVCW